MPDIYETKTAISDPLIEKLLNEKKTAREFQERRHVNWTDNYELYRNKVRTNRLTQRQAVNIPLMKETVKTLISRIDETPNVDWKELGGDEVKELMYQAIWDDQFKKKRYEWMDIVDKKNVLLYGLSTRKLNIAKDGPKVDVLDVYDVVYDPLMNPMDLETARFMVHQNIFRTLREVLADKRYSDEGKEKLKVWSLSKAGFVQSEKNKEELEKKQQRLKSMGVGYDEFARFAGGDVLLNLCEHYTKVWDKETKTFEKRVYTYAQDEYLLLDETLKDLIGVDFWPFVIWSEDVEGNDVYSDAVADLVRVPNQIVNVWFSQMVENRTLRNFQMHWYDSTIQGYQPQVYEPGPGRMLPAPGDPAKTIMPVNITGLDETLTAIDFLIRIVERGSGATAIEKGVSEKKQITLGEVEILVGKAMERSVTMAKFARAAMYDLASKWDKLIHANAPKMVKLFKMDRDGRMWPKVIYAGDWKSEAGYEPMVSSSSEQEAEQLKGVQKWQFITNMFPQNPAVRRIAARRALELVDLTPEELREVEDAEERVAEQTINQQQPTPPRPPSPGQQAELTPEKLLTPAALKVA